MFQINRRLKKIPLYRYITYMYLKPSMKKYMHAQYPQNYIIQYTSI